MSESGTPTAVSGSTVQRERVSVAPTSIEWTREFAQRWLESWNSHEADRLLALMTDDIGYRDDITGRRRCADTPMCVSSSTLPGGRRRT